MGNLTTNRATKAAYFTELDGSHITPFQFTPNELDFKESGKYTDRLSTGEYFPDMVWISGSANDFKIRMFIDRTMESFVSSDINADPFSSIKKLNSRYNDGNTLQILSLITAISNGNNPSGFLNDFRSAGGGKGNKVPMTSHSMSPDFKQNQISDGIGVIKDLENILYFVRPKGLRIDQQSTQSKISLYNPNPNGGVQTQLSTVKYQDFQKKRFVPPPMARFYYGSFWREGYIKEVSYKLTCMNSELVPRRMDAEITFGCVRWGYLTELVSPYDGTDAIDSVKSNNLNGIS